MKSSKSTLGSKWSNFIKLLFDPLALLLLICAIGSNVILANQEDTTLVVPLMIISSLLSSICGGVITHAIIQSGEDTTLEAKGKPAVRSLGIILSNVVALERRVRAHLKALDEDFEAINDPKRIWKLQLEEVVSKSLSLTEEITSSIDNWTDMIGDDDIRQALARWRSLTGEIEQLESERKELEDQLRNQEAGASEDKATLQDQISRKDKRIASLELQVLSEQAKVPQLATPFDPLTGLSAGSSKVSFSDESVLRAVRELQRRGLMKIRKDSSSESESAPESESENAPESESENAPESGTEDS